MSQESLDRREFQKLVGAAFGGLIAGATLGCSGNGDAASSSAGSAGGSNPKVIAKHTCRGLNECKGQGADGKNECAGRGACATVKQDCAGTNECKGLGGCGKTAGANDCKGQGGCHSPLMDEAWKTARKHFEERMTKAGKKFGEAPAKAS